MIKKSHVLRHPCRLCAMLYSEQGQKGGTMEDMKDVLRHGSIQQIVESMLENAVSSGASDIHMEPLDEDVRIRFRLDGVLCPVQMLPKQMLPQLTARIKVLSSLDIANQRIPMDGHFTWYHGNEPVDMRVSTMPTVRGEKTVIRLLGTDKAPMMLEELIDYDPSRVLLRELIHRTQGLFLVCGPTGSGKTSTLYGALSEIDSPQISIATLEDPVERHIDGFCQSQVNVKGGLDFQQGLRALLRQDPDVLVIGEIRDRETAEIAVRAALTGHVVLSTIHTSRAVEVPLRLIDMGLEPYLIAEALIGMASQRLVRKLCDDCKKVVSEGTQTRYEHTGCISCHHTGYAGRLCLCEVVPMGPHMRDGVRSNVDGHSLEKAAVADKAILMEECIRHARTEGLTDMTEIRRVYEE